MTLTEIRNILVGVDPDIRHHFSTETERNYTYWEETRRLPLLADDGHLEAWAFTVHRFTRDENDPLVNLLFEALDANPAIGVTYQGGAYDTDSGYIHHIWDCEGY